MTKSQRNGSVELLRFLFTTIIIFFHINLDLWDQQKIVGEFFGAPVTFFKHGNIAVEFFFLVTGCLMAKSVYGKLCRSGRPGSCRPGSGHPGPFHAGSCQPGSCHPGLSGRGTLPALAEETLQFVWHKARPILPYYRTACALTPVVRLVTNRALTIEYFALRLPSLLFLQRTGLGKPFIGCTWYLSSMLLALVFAYPLCRRFYRFYTHLAGPVLGCLLLWAIIAKTGSLGDIQDWFYITYKTNVRAFAEISLGAAAFECSRFLQGRIRTCRGRLLLTAAAVLSLMLSIAYMCSEMSGFYALPVTGLLFAAVSILFSGEGALQHAGVFRHPVYAWLGAVSLPMYVSQTLLRMLVPHLFAKSGQWTQCFLIYLGTFLFAVILHEAIGLWGAKARGSGVTEGTVTEGTVLLVTPKE